MNISSQLYNASISHDMCPFWQAPVAKGTELARLAAEPTTPFRYAAPKISDILPFFALMYMGGECSLFHGIHCVSFMATAVSYCNFPETATPSEKAYLSVLKNVAYKIEIYRHAKWFLPCAIKGDDCSKYYSAGAVLHALRLIESGQSFYLYQQLSSYLLRQMLHCKIIDTAAACYVGTREVCMKNIGQLLAGYGIYRYVSGA